MLCQVFFNTHSGCFKKPTKSVMTVIFLQEKMSFTVNDGEGYVCSHCRFVFPNRNSICNAFAAWNRDMCPTCCQTHYAGRRMKGWVINEHRHISRQEAFFERVWSETTEELGAYDCGVLEDATRTPPRKSSWLNIWSCVTDSESAVSVTRPGPDIGDAPL